MGCISERNQSHNYQVSSQIHIDELLKWHILQPLMSMLMTSDAPNLKKNNNKLA